MLKKFFVTLLAILLSCIGSHKAFALDLKASKEKHANLKVDVIDFPSQEMRECVDHGLTVRLKFSYMMCRRERLLLSRCSEETSIVRDISADPVAGGVKVSYDTMDDEHDPENWRLDSAAQGWKKMQVPFQLPITRGSTKYVRVNVTVNCLGESSAAFSRFASIISLGFVNSGQEKTGWIHFDLAQDPYKD